MNATLAAAPASQDWNLPIEGMTCASCVVRVERSLRSVAGVTEATVNLATESAVVKASANSAILARPRRCPCRRSACALISSRLMGFSFR